MTLSGYLCLLETACGCQRWMRVPKPLPELRMALMYPLKFNYGESPSISDVQPVAARRFINIGRQSRGKRHYFLFREVR